MSAAARPFSGGSWLDPPAAPAASLLLAVSGDNRYLVDGNGDPFLVRGIAGWCLGNENTQAEAEARLDTEAANGVNTMLIQVLSRYQTQAPNALDGTAPFTTPDDLTTPNTAYFAKLLAYIRYGATLGIIFWLAPAWLGYDDGQGFSDMLASNTQGERQGYGAWLGTYFGAEDNIVWVGGGDNQTATNDEALAQDVIDGVLSTDTRHIVTWHWNFRASNAESVTPISFNSCYEWGDLAGQVTTAYGSSPTRPAIVIEARYEGNNSSGTYTSAGSRADILQAMCRGAKGYCWGHEGTWHNGADSTAPNPPHNSGNLPAQSIGKGYNLTTTDRLEFSHCMDIFESSATRPAHLLAPDQTVLSAGNGRACITPSGNYAIIFSPSGTQTIDRTKMSGSFRAYIVDPTSGVETEVAGGPFPNTSTQAIIPTTILGNNSRGATDYVIVLELD